MAPASHKYLPASHARSALFAALQLALLVLVLVSVVACLPVFHDVTGITGIDAMDEGAAIPKTGSDAAGMLPAITIVLIGALTILAPERSQSALLRGLRIARPLHSSARRGERPRGSGSACGMASDGDNAKHRKSSSSGDHVIDPLRSRDALAEPGGFSFLGEIPRYDLTRARARVHGTPESHA